MDDRHMHASKRLKRALLGVVLLGGVFLGSVWAQGAATGNTRGITPMATTTGGAEKASATSSSRIVVLEDGMPTRLSPLLPYTLIDQRVQELLHDALFRLGEDGRPKASLIEMDKNRDAVFAINTDNRRSATGRFKQAFFHDGSPITLQDLDCSLRAIEEASAKGLYATSAFAGLYVRVAKVAGSATERDFEVEFRGPQTEPRAALQPKLIPCHAFATPQDPKTFPYDQRFNDRPVGSGPFRMPADTGLKAAGKRLVLEAFPKYHAGAPKVGALEVVAEPSSSEKLNLLRSRQAQVIVRLSKQERVAAREARAKVINYYVRNWWYLGFNLHPKHEKAKLYGDIRFRQALALSLDRTALAQQLTDDICEAGGSRARQGCVAVDSPSGDEGDSDESTERIVTEPGAILVSGPFSPESRFYNTEVEHPTYDIDKARALLKQIPGVELVNAEGVLSLRYNKKPVTLSLGFLQDLAGGQDVAARLQTDLRQLGISLSLFPLDSASWEAKLPSLRPQSDGSTKKGTLDLTLGRWNFDQFDEIRPIFHSNGARNMYAYKNDVVDGLFKSFGDVGDYAEQQTIMRELHARIAADLPCVFLWEANQYSAFAPELRGYRVYSYSFYVHPERWGYEAPKKRR